jgi:hypothetical protein
LLRLLLELLRLCLRFLLLDTVEIASGDGALLTSWLRVDSRRLANLFLYAQRFDDFDIEDNEDILALQVVGCVLLDSGDATSDQLIIVNDVVSLSSKHSLDVVLAIAHDQTESVPSLGRRGHLLDLETLQDWYREELGGFIRIIEDHVKGALRER